MTMATGNDDKDVNGDGATGNEVNDDGSGAMGDDNDDDDDDYGDDDDDDGDDDVTMGSGAIRYKKVYCVGLIIKSYRTKENA